MRTPFLNTLALSACVAAVGLSACATGSSKKQQEENDALRTQLTEAKSTINAMATRIEGLETKLSTMTDKLESMRTSMETLANNQRPGHPTPVVSHPSESSGTPVSAHTAKNDPEAGFTNDEPVQAYRNAMVLFHAAKYSEAVLAFSGFVEKFPDHPLAGSALFHVGESYFREKEFKLALHEFQRVLTSYDRSPAVPDTLHELAQAEEALKENDKAARHRQLLSSLFPQSPAAAALVLGSNAASPTQSQETKVSPSRVSTGAAAAAEGAGAAPGSKLDAPPAPVPPPTAPLSGAGADSAGATGDKKTQ